MRDRREVGALARVLLAEAAATTTSYSRSKRPSHSQKLSASANCESVEAHVAGARPGRVAPAWHEGPESAHAKLGMRIERPSNTHGHKTQTVYQVIDTQHQPEQARSQSADIPQLCGWCCVSIT